MGLLLGAQMLLMRRLLRDPRAQAPWYNATGTTPVCDRHAGRRLRFAVGGMMPLSWFAIVRLGLVQAALGAVVVLTTVTLNRVMVVELSLPAILPGALVGAALRRAGAAAALGFGSDLGGRRTPWIIGGMAALCLGGVGAAAATALMASAPAGRHRAGRAGLRPRRAWRRALPAPRCWC